MKMTEIYAFTAIGPDGNESIIGYQHPTQTQIMVPIVGTSREMIDPYRPFAEKLAQALGSPVNLVKFSHREDLEAIS